MLLSYTSTFGASAAPANNPAPVAFQAETQTVSLTATETFYPSPNFAASSSCAAVTVTPATSTTGAFTITAHSPAATGCTVTVTGAATHTGTVGATVPAPGGVQVRWLPTGYQFMAPPVPVLAGPINMVGTGATFATTLMISESAYLGTFSAPVLSAGCGTNVAVAATTPAANLPSPASGSVAAFYTVTGSAAVASSANCTISTGDVTAIPASTNAIGVVVTTGTGSSQ